VPEGAEGLFVVDVKRGRGLGRGEGEG